MTHINNSRYVIASVAKQSRKILQKTLDCFVAKNAPRNDRDGNDTVEIFYMSCKNKIKPVIAVPVIARSVFCDEAIQCFCNAFPDCCARDDSFCYSNELYKSDHSEFILSIRASLFFLEPPLSCFSLAIAVSISSYCS